MNDPAGTNRQADFLARVTAGTTHDIRNVLAIIKESAGLVEDVVLAGGVANPDTERIGRSLSRITAQVERGALLMTHLNHLVHGAEEGRDTAELGEELIRAVAFSQRFAGLGHHRIEIAEGDADIVAAVNPMALQMLLFETIECLLGGLERPGLISIRTAMRGEKPGFEFSARESENDESNLVPPKSHGWGRVVDLAVALGASLEVLGSGGLARLELPLVGREDARE